LARQFYPEYISTFQQAYFQACKEHHSFLFLDLSQSVSDLLRFSTNIILGQITEVFAPVSCNEPIEIPETLPAHAKDSFTNT
jgi:hypothetical protein